MSIASRIGNYTILRILGAGGMAQILEARDIQSGQIVALKVQSDSSVTLDDLQRFRREADVLRGLSHPNVIQVYAAGTDNGRPYIAFELIKGGSVEQALQQHGAFSAKEALRLMIAILDGLAHAHTLGLIHRDIKPANVLLRPDGTPVVADFDLARPSRPNAHARITADGERLGTPAYMAPEQIRGDLLDARTDLYACGVMLYELLTGRLPFDGDLHQIIAGHLQKPAPTLRSRLPQANPDLELLVNQLLAKDSVDRPQTAQIVRTALQDIQAGRPTTLLQSRPATAATPVAAVPRTSAAPKSAPWVRQATIGLGIFYATLLIVLLIAVLLSLQPASPGGLITNTSVATVVRTSVEVDVNTPQPVPTATVAALPSSEVLQRATVAPTDVLQIASTEIASTGLLNAYESAQMINARPIETADGSQFSVGSLTIIATPGEQFVTIHGELRNDAATAREITAFYALPVDSATVANTANAAGVAQTILAAGEITPFTIALPLSSGNLPTSDTLHFTIASQAAEAPAAPSFIIENLLLLRQTELNRPVLQTIGTLKKNGTSNIALLRILITFYDTNNDAIGYRVITLENVTNIAASANQVNFIATIYEPPEGIVSYHAVVLSGAP